MPFPEPETALPSTIGGVEEEKGVRKQSRVLDGRKATFRTVNICPDEIRMPASDQPARLPLICFETRS